MRRMKTNMARYAEAVAQTWTWSLATTLCTRRFTDMTLKGEALKPNFSELQKIEADYDPEKDYDSPRIDFLVALMSRPGRKGR